MLTPLRRQRLLMQMSLYDLRAKTGVSVSKLSLVERGIEQANEDEKRRLSRALGVQQQKLFPPAEVLVEEQGKKPVG
jgi:transcriptional regulator with XRE-family HTH domain